MSERRSHWDASLISAVLADLRDVYDSGYGEEQAFRIIAAVEDWVLENYQGGEYDNPVEFTPEEAAIARVRDVCDLWQRRHDTSIRHPTAIPAIPITAVLRALDGDGDD